jgi:hypothetical protein
MATRLITVLTMVLAGCALNESALRQESPPLIYNSANPPRAVAECMARNMEAVLLGAHATVRPMQSPGGLEVIARGGDDSIYALAEVSANGKDTAASMWFSRILYLLRGPQETGMKFMLGC